MPTYPMDDLFAEYANDPEWEQCQALEALAQIVLECWEDASSGYIQDAQKRLHQMRLDCGDETFKEAKRRARQIRIDESDET